MRGESLEPGGCSDWPTSAEAAWIIAATPPPPGAPAVQPACPVAGAPSVVGAAASVWAPRTAWKELCEDAERAGCRAVCSSVMRAITLSTLIVLVVGRRGPRFNAERAGHGGPPFRVPSP